MDRWQGRVVLVTGASAGIGKEICRHLARKGMKVVGCARNVAKIQDLATEEERNGILGSITTIKCDLQREEEILQMFAEIRKTLGRIDVCINNAGLSFDASLLEGTTEQWRTMIDVNVLALCICTREAIKLMKEKGIDDGQIIHLGSMSGHRISEVPTAFMYVGAKTMVKMLTEGLRRELRSQGSRIKVASISPGVVETEFEYRCFFDRPETAKAIYGSMECLQGEDIVQSVLYILQSPPHVDVHDILIRPTEQAI